jgi:hypothetical protein
LEEQRIEAVVDDTNVAVGRSLEVRALRDAISLRLTEVLAEVEQVRPLQDAPVGVDRFVVATHRTLADLRERELSPDPPIRAAGRKDGG